MIQPKIQRVRSGEPIVMTAILRDINGLGSSNSSTDQEEYYKRASQEVAAAGILTSTRPSTSPASILRGPTSSTAADMNGQATTGRKVVTEAVVLKYDDPIPKDVERQLYRLNELLASVTTRWYVLFYFQM